MPLQSKLTIFFVLFLSLLVFQWLFFMHHEENVLTEEMSTRASVLTKNLSELSREPMLNYQISRLEMQVDSLKKEKDVIYARVVNSSFLVLADTRRIQEGWIYSGDISTSSEIDIKGSTLLAREPIIILGASHGMAEISFSLEGMFFKIRKSRILFVSIFIAEVLLLFGFAIFLEIQVIRPLRRIAAGVEKISADSINETLSVPGQPSIEILKVSSAINKMRDKLRKNQDELISKTRLATMGKIGFNLAHEIRNPLEAISGSVEILSSGISEDSSEYSYIRIIKEEIHNLNDYLSEFLEFTKSEPGEKEIISPAELLKDSLLLLGPLLKQHTIEINNSTTGTEGLWSVNPNQIKRVILNVLINSIEAIGSNGIIEIGLKTEKHNLVMIISDNGCGITVKSIDEVFDPYYTTKKNGSGIGLSLSRKIVEQHNGNISLISNNRDNRMTTLVSISFPRQEIFKNE